jgi:hypothetical protein
MTPAAEPITPWWAYGLWGVVGLLFGFGLAALLTIGAFFLLAAAVLALLALRLPACRNASAVAMLCGAGAVPLYIAWLNRDGPGEVCRSSVGGESCLQEWSPWPFVAAAVVLVVGGLLLARAVRPRPRPTR